MLAYVDTTRDRLVAESPDGVGPAGGPYTRAQLHARACIRCGREDGELRPNGHVDIPVRPGETPLRYPVVACLDDWGRPLC